MVRVAAHEACELWARSVTNYYMRNGDRLQPTIMEKVFVVPEWVDVPTLKKMKKKSVKEARDWLITLAALHGMKRRQGEKHQKKE